MIGLYEIDLSTIDRTRCSQNVNHFVNHFIGQICKILLLRFCVRLCVTIVGAGRILIRKNQKGKK